MQIVLTAVMALIVAWLFFDYIVVKKWLRSWADSYCRNRVWCVCRVNNRIGLVTRRYYDQVSREYWRWELRSQTEETRGYVRGHFIAPYDVVILDATNPQALKLLRGLLLERREFLVPPIEMRIEEAYKKINGWWNKYPDQG